MDKLIVYLKTKSFRNTILLAIGTVVGVALLLFFSLGFYTNHGVGVPVPKVTELPIERALEILKAQGFDYQIDSVFVTDQQPGMVTQQDPDPGTNVKENRVIYLTMVTRMAPNVALPNIELTQYISAESTLSNYGLKVGDTTYQADTVRDRILEVRYAGRTIKAGTMLPKGSKVDLVLGNGKGGGDIDLPDLIKQDLDAARFILKGQNLAIGTISYQGPITDSSNLVVVSQFPMKTDSTTKVSNGTRINLTVTQGKK